MKVRQSPGLATVSFFPSASSFETSLGQLKLSLKGKISSILGFTFPAASAEPLLQADCAAL